MRKWSVFITLIFLLFLRSGFAAVSVVPHGINFSGILTDAFGIRITNPIDSRFVLSVGSAGSPDQVIWCAEYTALTPLSDGSVFVALGRADASQGSVALNGSSTSPCTPGGSIDISPGALSVVSSNSNVSLSIQLNSGTGWETLSPSFKLNSSLFALRAESLGGYTEASFPKFDKRVGNLGAIMSLNEVPVIDSNGNWIGSSSSGSFSSLSVSTAPTASDHVVNRNYADSTLGGLPILPSPTPLTGQVLTYGASGWTYTSPATFSTSLPRATSIADGYLAAGDFLAFNNKQNAPASVGTAGQLFTSGGAGTPTWTNASSATTASAVVQRDSSQETLALGL